MVALIFPEVKRIANRAENKKDPFGSFSGVCSLPQTLFQFILFVCKFLRSNDSLLL